MSMALELQIAQICIAAVQVVSLWVLVFFAVRAWNKERMSEYEYYTLLIGLQEGHEYSLAHYRRAERYARKHDSKNVFMWQKMAHDRQRELRKKARKRLNKSEIN